MTLNVLAAGPTPDALLSTSSALLLGLLSTAVAVVIAIMQSKNNKSEQNKVAAIWEKQAEEIGELYRAQAAAELGRAYDTIASLNKTIADRDRDIRRLRGEVDIDD